jgi:hypothetical protein
MMVPIPPLLLQLSHALNDMIGTKAITGSFIAHPSKRTD